MQPFPPQAKDSRKIMEFVKRGIRDEMPTPPVAKTSGPAVSIMKRVKQNGHCVREPACDSIYSI